MTSIGYPFLILSFLILGVGEGRDMDYNGKMLRLRYIFRWEGSSIGGDKVKIGLFRWLVVVALVLTGITTGWRLWVDWESSAPSAVEAVERIRGDVPLGFVQEPSEAGVFLLHYSEPDHRYIRLQLESIDCTWFGWRWATGGAYTVGESVPSLYGSWVPGLEAAFGHVTDAHIIRVMVHVGEQQREARLVDMDFPGRTVRAWLVTHLALEPEGQPVTGYGLDVNGEVVESYTITTGFSSTHSGTIKQN
jgi:hypothetical protein